MNLLLIEMPSNVSKPKFNLFQQVRFRRSQRITTITGIVWIKDDEFPDGAWFYAWGDGCSSTQENDLESI